MNNTMLAETVALLEAIAAQVSDIDNTLPALDLPAEELAGLAGDMQRVRARLRDIEERLATAGPTMV